MYRTELIVWTVWTVYRTELIVWTVYKTELIVWTVYRVIPLSS